MQDSLVSAAHEDDEGDGLPSWLPPCCHALFASCFKAMAGAAQELEEKLEVAAHVAGVVQVTGTLGPTQMMLCKADGSDKHSRWFWVSQPRSPASRTVSWGKKRQKSKVKGPFRLLGAAPPGPGLLALRTDDAKHATVLAKPPDQPTYDAWLRGCGGSAAATGGGRGRGRGGRGTGPGRGRRYTHKSNACPFLRGGK